MLAGAQQFQVISAGLPNLTTRSHMSVGSPELLRTPQGQL